jgi:16S rRNA (uracil1498-N3)-methyltransferase
MKPHRSKTIFNLIKYLKTSGCFPGFLFLFLTGMSLPIFYIETNETGDFINLNEDTSKHVVQVLRMKVGEQLQLTDGKGTLLTTELADDHKKRAAVRVLNRTFKEKPQKKISIAISLLKNASRFEWFLEKATEVGVTEIVPIISERTEKQHFRFDRMNSVLIAAMLQSQQVHLPILHQPTALEKIISASNYDQKLIAHCLEENKRSIREFANNSSTQILIGPEGDFTSDEITAAISQRFVPVTLGTTRLRTETAGVVAATFLAID